MVNERKWTKQRINKKPSLFRKPAKNLNIHRRHLALTSNEQVFRRQLRSLSMKTFAAVHNFAHTINSIPDSFVQVVKRNIIAGIMFAVVLVSFYLQFNLNKQEEIYYQLPNWRRNINSFSESECWNFFETRKTDLPRLLRVWRIPNKVVFDNRSSMPGEEVMLRALYELVSGEDQYNIAMNVFGRDQTAQSRAINWFINHMYESFQDLLTDNLDWWYRNGYFKISMEAIKAKFGGNDLFSTFAFIDCNCLECARPGGGPSTSGPDADRWDPSIQKAFYNGWKSNFGLKHQTLDNALGMTMDLFGPWSLRKNDLYLLRESRLNRRIRDLQIDADFQYTIYGDSIYPRLSHLKSSWRMANMEEWMRAENKRFAKVRISIEWNYMITGSL